MLLLLILIAGTAGVQLTSNEIMQSNIAHLWGSVDDHIQSSGFPINTTIFKKKLLDSFGKYCWDDVQITDNSLDLQPMKLTTYVTDFANKFAYEKYVRMDRIISLQTAKYMPAGSCCVHDCMIYVGKCYTFIKENDAYATWLIEHMEHTYEMRENIWKISRVQINIVYAYGTSTF